MNRLLVVGAIVLGVGIVTALIGGIGEIGYYQCVASSGPACTASGSNQYITVFLANNDIFSLGANVAFMGLQISLVGILVGYISKLANDLKASMSPQRICPKCGVTLSSTAKFCPNCGNKFGE
jgi:ribosomal protein L40E